MSPCIPALTLLLNCYTLAVSAALFRPVYESSFWTSKEVHKTSHDRAVVGSSNDLVHHIVLWVVAELLHNRY